MEQHVENPILVGCQIERQISSGMMRLLLAELGAAYLDFQKAISGVSLSSHALLTFNMLNNPCRIDTFTYYS